MEEVKKESPETKKNKQEEPQNDNVLEIGKYHVLGPESGEIEFDKIVLNAESGAKRIWKVKKFSTEEIVLKVEKFG